MEEILYDTSEKEFRVMSIELKIKKGMIALKQKYKMPFVGYRNSVTRFHGRLKPVNHFKSFDDKYLNMY